MTRDFVGAMGLPPSSFRREALETQIHPLFGTVQFERGIPVGTVTRTAALAERDRNSYRARRTHRITVECAFTQSASMPTTSGAARFDDSVA